jgi:succinate dehydrogenase / fumarate reductase membrane anchor subunit
VKRDLGLPVASRVGPACLAGYGQFGSARDGLREWRLQCLTAIAVIPLSLYFAASVLSLATSDRKTAADWLSLPVPVLVAILLVLAGITHALVGVRSVVLDYVHTRTHSR